MRVWTVSRIIAFLLAVCPSLAFAGAWTQDAGQFQAILSASYYSADHYYDNAGYKRSQRNYNKYELNPYMEYGLHDGTTIGANLFLQRAEQNSTHWGVGDSEFFLRQRLVQLGGLTLSAEPMIKLPSPESRRELPVIGGKHPDVGLGLNAGYGFDLGGAHHFIDIGTQYRYRFGSPEDQLRFSGTLGIGITPQWSIMPQAFITQRIKTPANPAFTQSSGDDYDLTNLQLSALYQANADLSLQLGAFSHVDGKNAGAGDGIIFAVWKRF